jgi:CRP/FNR family transcriptional regulator, cyclic AMP receptor protein
VEGPVSEAFADALSSDDRAALIERGRRRRYPRGAELFHEGDRSDFVVVLLEGRIKVVIHGEDGTESLLSVRGPGAIVGELAGVDDSPRLATVLAVDPVTAQVLRAAEFEQFIGSHPSAAVALLRVVVGRLREADRRRAEFGGLDVTRRLAQLLADLVGGDLEVRLSQEELAGMIGASRESVARALRRLRDARVVTTGRRRVTVVDAGRLRLLAR